MLRESMPSKWALYLSWTTLKGLQRCNRDLNDELRAKLHRVEQLADEEPSTAGSSPAADNRPLTDGNAAGRGVLVPRAMWPRETCEENNSRGWTANQPWFCERAKELSPLPSFMLSPLVGSHTRMWRYSWLP